MSSRRLLTGSEISGHCLFFCYDQDNPSTSINVDQTSITVTNNTTHVSGNPSEVTVCNGDNISYEISYRHYNTYSGQTTVSGLTQYRTTYSIIVYLTQAPTITVYVDPQINNVSTDAIVIFEPRRDTNDQGTPTDDSDGNPGTLCEEKINGTYQFTAWANDQYYLTVIKKGYEGYHEKILLDSSNLTYTIQLTENNREYKYLSFSSTYTIYWIASDESIKRTIKICFDNGNTILDDENNWTTIESSVGGTAINIPSGSVCRVKYDDDSTSASYSSNYTYGKYNNGQSPSYSYNFFSPGSYSATIWGNISSLRPSNPSGELPDCAYYHLFGDTTTLNSWGNHHKYDMIMNETIYNRCSCSGMFERARIQRPPQVIIDTYNSGSGNITHTGNMFKDCASLGYSPLINASVLRETSCYGMFQDCMFIKKIFCYATDISATSSHASITAAGGLQPEGSYAKCPSSIKRIFYMSSTLMDPSTGWPDGANGVPKNNGWERSSTTINIFA